MPTKNVRVVLKVFVPSVLALAACGDDETTNGEGGQGGAAGVTTATSATTGASFTVELPRLPQGVGGGGLNATAGTGGSGTGGGEPENPDTCPGAVVTVSPGDAMLLEGSTAGLADDLEVFCAPGSASPDAVYQLTLPSACSFSMNVTGVNGFEPALAVRLQQCGAELAGDLCEPTSKPIIQHLEPMTFWVIVDGLESASGDYTVELACGTPTCGDGVLNPGEACDFGPDVPGDTCTATCEVDDTDAADVCSALGAPFAVPAGASELPDSELWFHNGNATDDYKGTCMFGGENGGKDEVFALVPEVSGALTISTAVDLDNLPVCNTFLEPECWYSFLYVRGADCQAGAELACNGIDVNTGVNELTLDVVAGETYHLFVDGLNDTFLGEGPYTVHLELQ